jgi:hypothetical protein
MKTKTHGWVFEDTENGGFVTEEFDSLADISQAEVFSTRKTARTHSGKLDTDIVRKVKIDKNGKAVKIIPGR